MADLIDEANDLVDHYTQQAIHKRVQPNTPSGTQVCIDCDERIPEARRKAYPAAIRCIDCQNLYK